MINRRSFCITTGGAALVGGGLAAVGLAEVGLGPGAGLGGKRPFPGDNAWNQDISKAPVDPQSDVLILGASARTSRYIPISARCIRARRAAFPYVVVPGTQPKVPVRFQYADESDPALSDPSRRAHRGGAEGHGAIGMSWSSIATTGSCMNCSPRPRRRWLARGVGGDLRPELERGPAGGLDLGRRGGAADLSRTWRGMTRWWSRGPFATRLRFTCVRTRRAYVAPARHFASSKTDAELAADGNAGPAQGVVRRFRRSRPRRG